MLRSVSFSVSSFLFGFPFECLFSTHEYTNYNRLWVVAILNREYTVYKGEKERVEHNLISKNCTLYVTDTPSAD
mgnify:CR=1 FL=1